MQVRKKSSLIPAGFTQQASKLIIIVAAAILFVISCDSNSNPKGGQLPPSQEVSWSVNGLPEDFPPLPINPNPKFQNIGLEQGLSQSTVFCAMQDSLGYMWFGTENGLNRFDGYTFDIFKSAHDNSISGGLSGSWITSIYEDHSKVLWIGTGGGGLNRYDRVNNQFIQYRHDPDTRESLSHDEVTAILEDSSRNLWIGTKKGLNKFNRETGNFHNFTSLVNTEILCLFEDKRGTLWIGTNGGGLSSYDSRLNTFNSYSAGYSEGNNGARNIVRAITEDQQGILWIGTDGGLATFNKVNSNFDEHAENISVSPGLSNGRIFSIYEDRDSIIWVGVWGEGLYAVDPEQGVLHNYRRVPSDPNSLSSNVVVSLYQDREGTFWVGTIAGGVNKLTVDNRFFSYVQHVPGDKNSLSDNWVRSILEDKSGNLWISTGGHGLNRYSRDTDTWYLYTHNAEDPATISDDFLSQVTQDSSGNIWVATENGIDLFNPNTESFTHHRHDSEDQQGIVYSNKIRKFYETKTGELWVATSGGGFSKFDPSTEEFTNYQHDPQDPNSLTHNKVWDIHQDGEGYVWIGTSNGLDRFNPETETFTHFKADPEDPGSLSADFISTIIEDDKGVLWLGTGGGLNRFNPETESFSHWTEEDGLPSNTVYALSFDNDQNLWISTNNGLSRFDPVPESFTNFHLKDGLPIIEFNGNVVFKSDSGKLFFGGINGFVSFDPALVRKNTYIPPIILTSLKHNSKQVQIDSSADPVEKIIINWPDDSFEFECSALSFSNPEQNQYAYMLDGFDDEWVQGATIRLGRYQHLPGGSYTLRVKGSNDDDLWNETGIAVEIEVIPPFWETLWFRLTVLLLAIGAAYGVYRFRVRNIEKRNKKLAQEVDDQTAELKREITQRLAAEESLHHIEMENAVAAERSRLARELHDSVTQSLHGSTMLAEAGQRLADAGDLERSRGYFKRLGQISQQALKEMRLLVYELRPAELKEVGLVEAVRHRLDAVEKRAGVEARLTVDNDIDLPDKIEEAVFRIIQEALNNALKHSDAEQIEVTIRVSDTRPDHRLTVEVKDNGSGFEVAAVMDKGGMGLVSIRERTSMLGGSLDIRSETGNGTSIKVVLDLRKEHHA